MAVLFRLQEIESNRVDMCFFVCQIFLLLLWDQRGCLISEKVLGRGGDEVEGWYIIWQYIEGLFYFQSYTPQRQVAHGPIRKKLVHACKRM